LLYYVIWTMGRVTDGVGNAMRAPWRNGGGLLLSLPPVSSSSGALSMRGVWWRVVYQSVAAGARRTDDHHRRRRCRIVRHGQTRVPVPITLYTHRYNVIIIIIIIIILYNSTASYYIVHDVVGGRVEWFDMFRRCWRQRVKYNDIMYALPLRTAARRRCILYRSCRRYYTWEWFQSKLLKVRHACTSFFRGTGRVGRAKVCRDKIIKVIIKVLLLSKIKIKILILIFNVFLE
jgi:hypothetical protein